MIEYAKYTLNIRKMKVNDLKFEKKMNNILMFITVSATLIFIVFLDFFENPSLWMDILGLSFVVIVLFVEKLFERKKILFDGESDLEVKRDNFYFYKDGEMKLELLYKNTDIKYRKTIQKDMKMIIHDCGEIYYFYIKKDYNISGYEKLYFDLEETDYHEKIPVLKEIIFKIVILGITAAIILMQ